MAGATSGSSVSITVMIIILPLITCDGAETSSEGHSAKIQLAGFYWDHYGQIFTQALFIVLIGLFKTAFHHAFGLSEWVPESCVLISLGIVFGYILQVDDLTSANHENDTANSSLPDDTDYYMLPPFTSDLFFFVLLPPIVLESAYSLYDVTFFNNLGTILTFAVVGTLLNTFGIGLLLFSLYSEDAIIHMDTNFKEIMVFAALISAVDPVAVLSVFEEIGVNKSLYYLVFGESLLNDAVTIVLYNTMLAFTAMPTITMLDIFLSLISFFTVSLGGLITGIIFGFLTALITRTTEETRVVEPLALLGLSYLGYVAAEIFDFSGIISLIGCGLTQAHYAMKNVSHRSYITTKYFTKMMSSTCDAIIFLFLGMTITKNLETNVSFALWSLLLCFVVRFIVTPSLSKIANRFRSVTIREQEIFVIAYGGLRGGIAYSLVQMLDTKIVRAKPVFLSTTIYVILFTVFLQGGTIKLLVQYFHIRKLQNIQPTMNEEIMENVIMNLMAGIEDIAGVHGSFYTRVKLVHIDKKYLQPFLLRSHCFEPAFKTTYEKLCLMDHYAHLYGPMTIIEDNRRKSMVSYTISAADDISIEEMQEERLPGVQWAQDDGEDHIQNLRKALRGVSVAQRNVHNRNQVRDDDDNQPRHLTVWNKRHMAAKQIRRLAYLQQPDAETPKEGEQPEMLGTVYEISEEAMRAKEQQLRKRKPGLLEQLPEATLRAQRTRIPSINEPRPQAQFVMDDSLRTTGMSPEELQGMKIIMGRVKTREGIRREGESTRSGDSLRDSTEGSAVIQMQQKSRTKREAKRWCRIC